MPTRAARFAFLAVHEAPAVDSYGWVELEGIEAQQGRWPGSQSADFYAGLEELVTEGWIEANVRGDAYRTTSKGRSLSSRVTGSTTPSE